MINKKIIIVLNFIIVVLLLSCKAPITPDNSTIINNTLNTNQTSTNNQKTLEEWKREIDQKYPYWKVYATNFAIVGNLEIKRTITIAEKKKMAEIFALQRLIINIPEFEQKIKEHTGIFIAGNSGVIENGNYNIKKGEEVSKALDKDRLLQVIRESDFTYTYSKFHRVDYSLWATLGELGYAFHGYKNYRKGNTVWGNHRDWTVPYGYSDLASMSFHENLHLIGFSHPVGDNGNSVNYKVQAIVLELAKRFTGEKGVNPDLKDKYSKELQELMDFYNAYYANEFTFDTKN